MFLNEYDVIVVGAGHAGSEAAAAANLGSKLYWCTMSLQNIAQMSCNPAIGIAKDKLCEIDALVDTWNCFDRTAIQFKMLNKSGPAMWSPRSK
jgi:tRNA uridine 5-carboxymethylaminomethyl modification enzyme